MTDQSGARAPSDELTRARTCPGDEIERWLYARAADLLDALLENPALREPHLLILLARRDLPARTITTISRNAAWMRSYAMKTAVLKHPLTPRHIALPLLKHVYLFDLLGIAQTPGLAADLRRLAEDEILGQLGSIALGQKLTLARRGSHRIAAGLLLAGESQVIEAALENPSLTDQAVSQALASEKSAPALTTILLGRQPWLSRRPVLLGMMRSRHLSLANFAALLGQLTAIEMDDLQQDPRLPRNLREYVRQHAAARRNRRNEVVGTSPLADQP